MATKSLTFELFGRDRTASSSLDAVGKKADSVGGRAGKAAAAIGVAMAAAVASIVAVSVKAAAEMEKVDKQTEAVIKSTGGVAGKTVAQIEELSKALSKVSGIDDEVIQAGENILLTFTKIQDVNFDAATQAALDMSVALGQDMNSAAIMLGKALNDPIAGISSLSRSGVQFTEQQKDVIRALVETGQTAEAQKIILAELETQFGGSAEAFGTTFEGALGRFESSLGDIQEKIGMAFIPVLQEIVSVVEAEVLPHMDEWAGWIRDEGVPALSGFIDWVVEFKDILGPAAIALGGLTAAQWGLNVAMSANPIGAVILAIEGIAAAVLYFTTVNKEAGRAIADFQMGILSTSIGISNSIINVMESMINGVLSALNALQAPMNALRVAMGQGPINIPLVNFSGVTARTSWTVAAMNAAADYWQYGAPAGATQSSSRANRPLGFAEGGIVGPVPGGVPAVIGEGRYAEAILPLSPQVLSELGGGGRNITVEIHGNGMRLEEIIDVRIKRDNERGEMIVTGGKVRH